MSPTDTGRTEHPPLTESTVLTLAAIITAAHEGAPVARDTEDGALAGPVQYGTARHIVTDDERAYFAGKDDDIRDCFLRVTGGFVDHFWPLMRLVTEYQAGTFRTNVTRPPHE